VTPIRFLQILFTLLEVVAAVLAIVQAAGGTAMFGGYVPWMVGGLFIFALSLIVP
jgi:hypothetical protein